MEDVCIWQSPVSLTLPNYARKLALMEHVKYLQQNKTKNKCSSKRESDGA